MCEIDEAIRQGLTCPYCLCDTILVHASEVYDKANSPNDRMRACFECKAWVGCHGGTNKALGALADEATRRARMEAHAHFDKIWITKYPNYIPKDTADVVRRQMRRIAYAWLSEAMGLPEELTHIGMFDEAQCAEVVRLCRQQFGIFT